MAGAAVNFTMTLEMPIAENFLYSKFNCLAMIDNIVGIAGLPVGIILFLNEYGYTHMDKFLGINILVIAALTVIAIQISNILGAHITGDYIALSYIIHFFLIFPSVLYFLSLVVTLPQNIVASFPLVFASFILIEGLYSFFF